MTIGDRSRIERPDCLHGAARPAPASPDYDAHRRAGTDPYEANALLFAAAPDMHARSPASAREKAEAVEALKLVQFDVYFDGESNSRLRASTMGVIATALRSATETKDGQ